VKLCLLSQTVFLADAGPERGKTWDQNNAKGAGIPKGERFAWGGEMNQTGHFFRDSARSNKKRGD